jgi:hypothetical protein
LAHAHAAAAGARVNRLAGAALTSLGRRWADELFLRIMRERRRSGEVEQRVAVRPEREIRQSRITDPASGKLQLIRVVLDSGKDGDTVVTVYRTSKVRKYWRDE